MGKNETEKRRAYGSGSVIRRGEKYAAIYWYRGKQRWKTFDDEKKAERFLVQIRAKKQNREPLLADYDRIKVELLFELALAKHKRDGNKSINDANTRIEKHLKPFFGGMRVLNITEETLAAYIEHRQSEKAPPSTINRELHELSFGFNQAIRMKRLPSTLKPDFEKLTEDNIRTVKFNEVQTTALVKNLPPNLVGVAEFLAETGWRISETLTLGWRNVDFDSGEIRLDPYKDKGKMVIRMFPITTRLLLILQKQRRFVDAIQKEHNRICPYVFVRPNGKPLFERYKTKGVFDVERVKPASLHFYKHWKAACTAAGATGNRPHDMRRTASTRRRLQGMPDNINNLLSGWKEGSRMIDRYSKLTSEELKLAVRILEGQTVAEPLQRASGEDIMSSSNHSK